MPYMPLSLPTTLLEFILPVNTVLFIAVLVYVELSDESVKSWRQSLLLPVMVLQFLLTAAAVWRSLMK